MTRLVFPFILSPFPRVQPDFRAVCLPTTPPRVAAPAPCPAQPPAPETRSPVSRAGEADRESGELAGHENCECSNLRGGARHG